MSADDMWSEVFNCVDPRYSTALPDRHKIMCVVTTCLLRLAGPVAFNLKLPSLLRGLCVSQGGLAAPTGQGGTCRHDGDPTTQHCVAGDRLQHPWGREGRHRLQPDARRPVMGGHDEPRRVFVDT
jgi:hypothetical protein